MPSPEANDLYQPAVYWPFVGNDFHGQAVVGPPVQIRVRFLTVRDEAKRPDGTTVILGGTAVASQRLLIDSHLWMGLLSAWTGTGTGGPGDSELMQVVGFSETPDIKDRYMRREVRLMRLHSGGGQTG